MIGGNQKWKGAAPIFIKIVAVRIKGIVSVILVLFKSSGDSSKIDEPTLWIKKYLMVDSVLRFVWGFIIKGTMENILISILNHIINQLGADRIRRVDKINIEDNKNEFGEGFVYIIRGIVYSF